jgi:hypothetical protein
MQAVLWSAKYMLFLCFVLILGLYLVMEVVSQWRALQPLPRRIESDDLKALQVRRLESVPTAKMQRRAGLRNLTTRALELQLRLHFGDLLS